jgi:hypothetical protein
MQFRFKAFSRASLFRSLALLTNAQEQPALEDAFKGILLMGTALNRAQIYEEDTRGMALVKAQFNAITPENILKGGSVHPSLGI